MVKPTFVFLVFLLLLSSCSSTPQEESVLPPEKKPFLIETKVLGQVTEEYSVEKSARLTAGSSLILTAESVGEVTAVAVKEGSLVKRGSRLVSLKDTVNSYDLRVAQAQNTVEIQDASIESTKLNLDQAVENTKIAYEIAKKNYDTLKNKNELIVDTLKNTNLKTLQSYNESYKTYLSTLDGLMNNFLYEGDKILGITTSFEYLNDGWEPYLGIRVGNSYASAKSAWDKLYASRGDLRAKREKSPSLTESSLQEDLELIITAYRDTQAYVDAMIFMLQNNAVGAGLSQPLQDGWVATWNGIKSQIQGSEASYNAWKAQTLNFFQNYKNTEIATDLALKTLDRELTPEETLLLEASSDMRITYKSTQIDLRDRLSSASLALRQAENAREAAINSRKATLNQLSATRQSGVISLEQAQREYSKLTISAPYDGTVSRVIGSVGQRVSPGTPLIEIVSNTPEILIDLDADIARSLAIGDSVSIKYQDLLFSGTILAISRTAGSNLLYSTRISVPTAKKYIGSAVTVFFTGKKEKIVYGTGEVIILPLKSVKIISEQEGEIVSLGTGDTLRFQSVKLGKVIGESITIETLLSPDTEIVLSDVSNYDAEKFYLKKVSD